LQYAFGGAGYGVMNNSDPIRRVSVFGTGTVQIHPEHMAATWQPTWLWVLTSRRWTAPLPINVYVIEHRDGLVLFDTGQDRASITDPKYFPSGPLLGSLFSMARFEMAADQTLSVQLERLGYRAGDVRTVVLSHLHGDHIGGLREVAQAELLVSRAEWDTLSGPWPELAGIMRRHIQLPGLRWRQIEMAPAARPGAGPLRRGARSVRRRQPGDCADARPYRRIDLADRAPRRTANVGSGR
jgi:N-acyl homoserine lactone hydrolase